MEIKLLDTVLEQYDLDLSKTYKIIRTEIVQDDSYFIIINEKGKEIEVHELLAKEI